MKIRQVTVTPGVEWVEVEQADLRILCGCPADIIKHLMRRGLIVETVAGNQSCETGPNAILISDVMLQGGAFANLAEFPVLQMLYRQGLILPNHPNNTGQKPLLIGLPQQVEAQLSYIHRGNYGLTSKDELMAAGLTEEAAEEMMRIKLHFAFGKIQSANELLDCLPIDEDPTEIRNGVFIRRIGLNRYRFQYEDERIEVDINLPDSESYTSPYPLGMHRVSREYFSVIHSGEGDGWDIDRPCMSSIVSFQGRLYLVDAGPNLEAILKALSLSVNELEGIFHTHSHDDHLAGLTALLQSNHKLRYFAVPMVRAAVTKKLAALLSMDEEEFGNFFDVVDLDPETWNDVDGLEVKPMMSPHPVETSVFQFRALGSKGYKTYAHLADIAADRVLSNMVTDDAEQPGLSPALFQKVQTNYGEFANLKKIDIGGGLIHGDAEDFVDDESDKIVLAHVARPLTAEERQIGSGADFGTTDVLIPATQEYLRRLAYNYLQSYFPELPVSQLQILLNNELRTFNPHEILVREGEPINDIVLVLSGNAEALRSGSSEVIRLVAGDLFGELPVLRRSSASVTHRATSFLHALIIPGEQYTTLIDKYAQRQIVESLAEKRIWLRRTWLFGDGLSSSALNRIVTAMNLTELEDGEVETSESNRHLLRLIEDGVLKRFVGDYVLETLRSGSFFNESLSMFGIQPQSHLRSIGTSRVWDIPTSVISDIPIVRWKMFETSRRRGQMASDATRSDPSIEG